MEKMGRPDVDFLGAVMHREDRKRGFMVAFSNTADAESERDVFQKKAGRIIKLFTVAEILAEQHLRRMEGAPDPRSPLDSSATLASWTTRNWIS